MTLYIRFKGYPSFIRYKANELDETMYSAGFFTVNDRIERDGKVEFEYYVADEGLNKTETKTFTLVGLKKPVITSEDRLYNKYFDEQILKGEASPGSYVYLFDQRLFV